VIFRDIKFQFWPARTVESDIGGKILIIDTDLAFDISVSLYRI